jgi:ribosomal protein L11 methylase PrmA
VSLDEREHGLWSVGAYFETGEPDEIAARIRDRLGADAFGAPLDVEILPETDWVAAGLDALKPVTAGRFVVHGGHDRDRVPPGRIPIEIDAGQAFGTGHHGTTQAAWRSLMGFFAAALSAIRSISAPAPACLQLLWPKSCAGRCSQPTSIPSR